MIRSILCICFFLGLALNSQAQEVVLPGEGKLEIRTFDQASRQQYLDDKTYLYDRDILAKKEEEKRNLAKEQAGAQKRFEENIRNFFFDEALGSLSWGEFILYLFAILGVLFFVLAYFQVDVRSVLRRKSKSTQLTLENLPQDIQALNFDQLILQATQAGQFREAVRLLYLETLKSLAKTNQIDWKINKTNQDYLNELRSSPLRNEFSDLTLRYEYVWYGDFEIGRRGFDSMQQVFKRFQAKVI